MLLYGASGHCKVVIDCLLENKIPIKGIFDDNPTLTSILRFPVLGTYTSNYLPDEKIIIAIGDNAIRQKISNKIEHVFGEAVHPSAQISQFASVGYGSVVFHNSIIQADTIVGKHCIINTLASIDHDCFLEDFVHISPNATLSGGVKVGEGSHVGAGATIIQGITIGKWCRVGARAVVITDVPDFATVVGVPARIIKVPST